MNTADEFYIGWEAKAAPRIAKRVRIAVTILIIAAASAACLLAFAQKLIGTSVFQWGRPKTFSGVLKVEPYPHLLVPRPGNAAGLSAFSTYYLVAPWKFGCTKESVTPFDNKSVSLKGTLIYRENQTMIEVVPGSISSWLGAPQSMLLSGQIKNQNSKLENSQPVTLKGEIVDSKCFLGVMNPGQLTPHRACAIRCISGGVPPVLLVRPEGKPPLYFLLVSADGKPVNKQVLELVAEPVEITGQIERQGDLTILRADPKTYRRL